MAAWYGRRIRRGVAGTAVAAAAMAALTASQAPGPDLSPTFHSGAVTPPPGRPIDGGSSYYTEMPPLNSPTSPAPGDRDGGSGTGTGTMELPATVLDAYKKAQSDITAGDPRCNLRWQLLAAIGQVESSQAGGGEVDSEGTTITPILGPVLNGDGFANITDTDNGEYDGDSTRDRAVGPMQFIPSTWAVWGADGNGDGVRDPNNVYDAALAAGHYLCADGRDLSDETDLDRAILGYNHSREYVDLVKSWYEHFLNGGVVSGRDTGSGAGSGSGGGSGPGSGSSNYPVGPGGSVPPSASPSSVPGQPGPSASQPRRSRPTAVFRGTVVPDPAGSEIGGSPSPSPTWTVTTAPPSPPPTTTTSPSPTTTTCPTGSGSVSPTPTPTATPTATPTPTGSPSPTVTDDPCATASPSESGGTRLP